MAYSSDSTVARRAQWLAEAEPLVREIVRLRLRPHDEPTHQDTEDLSGEILLHLAERLHEGEAVRDWQNYVAVVAYRGCYEYFRHKFPKRYALKHRLRYVLSHHPHFRLLQAKRDEWHASLASWPLASAALDPQARTRLRQLHEDPQRVAAELFPRGEATAIKPETLLYQLLDWLQQPLELDQLVTVVAEWCNVHDQTAAPRQHAAETLLEGQSDQTQQFDQRRYLSNLWREITALSPRHCAALLLNLRDEAGHSNTSEKSRNTPKSTERSGKDLDGKKTGNCERMADGIISAPFCAFPRIQRFF